MFAPGPWESYIIGLMSTETLSSRAVLGIVFDGDDTLWNTEGLYDDARASARRVVVEAGLDGENWERLERRIDVENVAAMGFSPERFPTSCVQAYEEACRGATRSPDPAVSRRVRQAARSVFDLDPPVVAHARETLKSLRAKGTRLALLTKGDLELQARRVERSGLSDLFDVIEVVREKSPEVIRAVVDRLGIDVESACMVGNSIRSDLLPALDAGLRAVWIKAHVWEYERALDHLVDTRVTAISGIADISDLVS
jgi:putative hydrolase of the HAD superfamily